MTYRDLLEVLRGLQKKDSLLFVNDQHPVEARLGFVTIPMTRYDNRKLVQPKPDMRVSGVPIEDIPEKNYLAIISTPGTDNAEIIRNNTLPSEPYADRWVKYLETLPNTFLDQEVIFYSRYKKYGSNVFAAMKGGIGKTKIACAYDTESGYIAISTSGKEERDNSGIDSFARDRGSKSYHWGESIIFDMNRGSYYGDYSIFNPEMYGL